MIAEKMKKKHPSVGHLLMTRGRQPRKKQKPTFDQSMRRFNRIASRPGGINEGLRGEIPISELARRERMAKKKGATRSVLRQTPESVNRARRRRMRCGCSANTG